MNDNFESDFEDFNVNLKHTTPKSVRKSVQVVQIEGSGLKLAMGPRKVLLHWIGATT